LAAVITKSPNGSVKFCIKLEKIEVKSRVVQMPPKTGEPKPADEIVKTKTRIRIKRGPEQTELNAQGNEWRFFRKGSGQQRRSKPSTA
jgi:hypothetical protein